MIVTLLESSPQSSFLERVRTTMMAYVDPGSGALVVQVLVALVAGSLLYFKRLGNLFRKKDPNEGDETETERGSDEDKPVPASTAGTR